MIAHLQQLTPDRPPGPYLETVARNAIKRARQRDHAADPLGLVEIETFLHPAETVTGTVLIKPTREATKGKKVPVTSTLIPDRRRPIKVIVQPLNFDTGQPSGGKLDPGQPAVDEMVELRRLWGRLPARLRTILAGRIDGYSLPEIARRTGRSLRTVERGARRLQRALRAVELPWPAAVAGHVGHESRGDCWPGRLANAPISVLPSVFPAQQ
jgi:DNA-directed RNA polymerase specialized sigma24 family protein